MTKTHQISARNFRAEATIVQSESAKSKNRIELVWTTGFKGLRSDFGETFYEELEVSDRAVDLSRLNAGAPLLAQHEASLSRTIGVVEKAWIENGVGRATVRLSKRADVQDIVQDVLDGILRNVSVGYSIEEFTDTTIKGEKHRTLKATRWTPSEISIVAIGFDPMAQTLRTAQTTNEVRIINPDLEAIEMTEEEKAKLAEQAKAEADALTAAQATAAQEQADAEAKALADAKAKEDEDKKKLEEARRSAVAEFVKRQSEIQSAVRAAKLPVEFANDLIARNLSTAEASQEIFKTLENQNKPASQTAAPKETMTKRDQAIAALLNRVDAKRFKVDRENPFKQNSFVKIIEGVVERNPTESDAAFVKRATVTSDLPQLLSNVANKLMGEDGAEKFTYHRFAGHQTMKDFNQTPIVQLSGVVLAAKTEGGAYTTATLVDSDEKITLEERGILIDISQKAIVNDNLGALKALPAKAQAAGHRDIEKRMYALLASASGMGPTMADGKTLFHADHNNSLVAAGGPTVANISAANVKMAAFADNSGEPLDLRTKYIVCGPDLEFIAKQSASSALVPNTTSTVNPYAGELEVIVSSRVTAGYWYAIADKEEMAALVYGTQEGMDQPNVETEVDFKSSNLQTKIEFPNAVAAASTKGIVKVTAS